VVAVRQEEPAVRVEHDDRRQIVEDLGVQPHPVLVQVPALTACRLEEHGHREFCHHSKSVAVERRREQPTWRQTSAVPEDGLLRKIDAVTVPVPDLDQGLRFYRDGLGHDLLWRDDSRGQAGLRMPETDAEIVLALGQAYEPDWLVTSAAEAAEVIVQAGGRVVSGPIEIPVGSLVVVADPFGNVLVLVDLSKGRYTTGAAGDVTGVREL
jgi:predicted enzyme related to lactoylglutathione lyase